MLSFDGLEGAALEAAQAECILAKIGSAIGWIFTPLGWTQGGNGWKMAVAAISGLIAKENVVATFGMLFGFAEVAEDGTEFWGNLASCYDSGRSIRLSGIQPLMCTLLRSNGCYQERDEQYKMVLVCNRISVWFSLCSILMYLPDRYIDHNRYIRYWNSCCFCTCNRIFYICYSDLTKRAIH